VGSGQLASIVCSGQLAVGGSLILIEVRVSVEQDLDGLKTIYLIKRTHNLNRNQSKLLTAHCQLIKPTA